MTTVAIVQPYVPSYRVPFFERLSESLLGNGVSLKIIAGRPSAEQAQRGDAQMPDWLVPIASRDLRIGSRTLSLALSRGHWVRADAVIVPHQGSSLDALLACFGPRRARKVGVWGHIAPYTSPPNPVDGLIERAQLRRADHVFAYTPGGAQFATLAGVSHDRITVVMNTVGTNGLRSRALELRQKERVDLGGRSWDAAQPVLAYVGGLDRSKRIGFLREALDRLWRTDPAIPVIVAGRGSDEHLLTPAVERGQVVMVGYADDEMLARISVVARALLMPGRVGLVAVHALAMRLPVITTKWAFHAPEFEYLVEGDSLAMSDDDPSSFADLAARVAKSPRRASMGPSWNPPTMDEMVGNYSRGVLSMLKQTPRASGGQRTAH